MVIRKRNDLPPGDPDRCRDPSRAFDDQNDPWPDFSQEEFDLMNTFKLYYPCEREWIPSTSDPAVAKRRNILLALIDNVEEGPDGADVIFWECEVCGESHQSKVVRTR